MLIIIDNEIQASTGAQSLYDLLKPWQHASGCNLWLIDDVGGTPFVDSDGTTYNIRQRTQVEIEATPEYAAWQVAQEAEAKEQAARDTWQDLPQWVRTADDTEIDTYIAGLTTITQVKTALGQMAKTLRRVIDLQKLNYGG